MNLLRRYKLPPCITINQDTYDRWLTRKARSVKQRGREQDSVDYGGLSIYKNAIHDAVCKSNGKDFFTGEQLDWSLLSKWNNGEAKEGKSEYLRKFSFLPTVDHYDGRTKLNFVICSSKVNDAKNHMSHDEFLELCRKVIKHDEQKKTV